MATANSGLLQWLLPDFPTENPLLNGMFCYIFNSRQTIKYSSLPIVFTQTVFHQVITKLKTICEIDHYTPGYLLVICIHMIYNNTKQLLITLFFVSKPFLNTQIQ